MLLTFGILKKNPKTQNYFVVKEELKSWLKNLLEKKDGV